MESYEIVLIFFLPLFLFVIAALIVWLSFSRTTSTNFMPLVIVPSGPTGATGQTGATGYTGCGRVICKNLDIVNIDPYIVKDITSCDSLIFVLTFNSQILVQEDDGCIVTHDLTSWQVDRILIFSGRLYIINTAGEMYVLMCNFYDKAWTFTPVNNINCQGHIQWATTTAAQDYLWVTYTQGNTGFGHLYNYKFKIKDTACNDDHRIYGKNTHSYASLNVGTHTLHTISGWTYNNVVAALLDAHNDLFMICLDQSPPLLAYRLVNGYVYTLLTPGCKCS